MTTPQTTKEAVLAEYKALYGDGKPAREQNNIDWLSTALDTLTEAVRREERERIWLEANKLPMHEGRADLISLIELQALTHPTNQTTS